MKKQFINVLLCGAMVLSTGAFTSCSDDDDDLKSRLTVVEGAIGELKEQLSKALTTGASIIKAEEVDGVWTLTLSNGEVLVIKGSAGGGGGDVSIVENENSFTITINGTAYVLLKGSAVNSLIYSPEYADGIVEIGNTGAKVKFLATPAVSADALKNATFDIAEAHEVKTRGGNGLFKIDGDVTIDGDHLLVPIKALGVDAGKTYAVAVQMDLSGTSISSNYFTVKVDDDFSFNSEVIGGYTIKSEYNAKSLADNYEEITFKGSDFLKVTSFKDFFSELPDGAEFEIASKSKQPGGQAQEKWDALKANLSKNGTWAFNERLGTSFNGNAERKGFLFNVVASDVVKAKVYIVINDELAGLDFVGLFTDQAEAEWGGREKSLPMGAQTIDMQKIITEYETEFPIIHGGNSFFESWTKYVVTLEDAGDVIYNDSEKLVLGSVGKAYIGDGKSRGIYWFNHGFAVYVPEALATDGKYKDENGKEYSGGEGYGYDFWGRGVGSDAPWNVKVAQDGKISIPATYTGYGLRLGIGAAYEYAYGDVRLSKADQMGLFFFNRRLAPAGATMPAPAP
ncbi:hypothetical protein [Bacteroides sp. 51]|uniref:hypothetical protein n=1 Tax=Bacteroides sp. 51 TaxID=2302938 RepID=UPI0013D6AD70|nr:hypothetical protein [Bacteroides sp. 51]NDV84053.1 hypothetical protein [Bacteroides sp. 51]